MNTPKQLGTDTAGTPLIAGPRPDDEEFDALPDGTDLDAARAVPAHEVRDGDLVLADFPDAGPGVPREADYFTTAYTAQVGECCGECSQCHNELYSIGGVPDHQVRYCVLGSEPDAGCFIWLRNEPVLIVPGGGTAR